MSAVRRGLGGRTAAVSLAVLAMLAGAATYAWLAGLAPTLLQHPRLDHRRCWSPTW